MTEKVDVTETKVSLTVVFLQTLTVAVVAVGGRELHSHDLLQVLCHAHSPEWRREVNLLCRPLWAFRVIRHLVSSSDVLHHS